ncbi:MAG: hypothetical protein JWR24_82 [Actinoallomurus sp.]|nr:hypothetical protein [Actinoallomurus sp.]
MTANAGKGGGKSGQRSTRAGAKSGQPRKKTSVAKPPSDEVTLKTTSDVTNGSQPSDKAEETPGRKVAGYGPADEATTEDSGARLPAFSASKDDEPAKESPKTGEPAPSSGRSPAMDVSAPTPGFEPSTPPADNPSRTPGKAAFDAAAKVSKLTGALRKPDNTSGGRKAPRKAHLQVARLEPWSVMKFSFVMSLVCFLVLFVAVVVLYVILSGLGVFDALSNTIRDLTSNDQGKSGGINPASWFSAARILSYTALIGVLNVLLITALATVWSVIYNMAADLVGGVEVTLKEADQ